MTSHWNPAGASTWCRLSGNLPKINGNVVVVVDDSSDKVSAFFEGELPSLPENLEARLLKIPAQPKAEEVVDLLEESLASLFPEIGPEFSKMGTGKWIEAIRKQHSKNDAEDRWLLVDSFHHILRAPALERKIFAKVLQELAGIPSFGVITGITTESAIETAALLNLMDRKLSGGSADEGDTTPIPLAEAGLLRQEISDEEGEEIEPPRFSQRTRWAAAACLAIGLLGGAGFYVFQILDQAVAESDAVVAFGLDEESAPADATFAQTSSLPNEPLSDVVVELIEPAGITMNIDELDVRPFSPPKLTAEDAEEFETGHQKKDWEFAPGEDAPEFEVQYFMGEAYCFGHGVEQDLKKGIAMLKASSRDGSEKAANLLGTCYSRGHGVERDYAKAHEFLELAIERGSPFALGNLGVLHLRGFGCEADPARAQEFFLKGAAAGDPMAAFFAAKCFEDGIGTEDAQPDKNRAVFWYLEAARWGHEDALAWCRERKLLTADEKTGQF